MNKNKNKNKNKNMNILFVTFNSIKDDTYGGAKATKRNYDTLCKCGNVCIYEILKKSNLSSVLSILQLHMPPLLNQDIIRIKDIIKNKDIEIVFFDSSLFGNLSIDNCKKIVYCHNVEADYINVRFKEKFGIKKFIYQRIANKCERESMTTADSVWSLTKRDANKFASLYGRKDVKVIPLSIDDKWNNRIQENN